MLPKQQSPIYLGFRLPNEYVWKTVSATSVVDCGFQCLDEECCASITYHASSEIYQKNCHLNNVLSLNYSGSLLRDEHANYYELVDVYKVSTVREIYPFRRHMAYYAAISSI